VRIDWQPADEELLGFVRGYLDSFCTWDVLVYLAHAMDEPHTVEELSHRVGRSQTEVGPCMERLDKAGLVHARREFGMSVFSTTRCERLRGLVLRFAEQQSQPSLRAEALRVVMAKEEERR
jgi:DNA-binding transcriptional ArsR family regulator